MRFLSMEAVRCQCCHSQTRPAWPSSPSQLEHFVLWKPGELSHLSASAFGWPPAPCPLQTGWGLAGVTECFGREGCLKVPVPALCSLGWQVVQGLLLEEEGLSRDGVSSVSSPSSRRVLPFSTQDFPCCSSCPCPGMMPGRIWLSPFPTCHSGHTWLAVPYTEGLGNEAPAHLWGLAQERSTTRVGSSEGGAGGAGRSHISDVLLGQPAISRLLFVGGVKKSVKTLGRKLITCCPLE